MTNFYERKNYFVNSAAFNGAWYKTQVEVNEYRGARNVTNRQSHAYEVSLCAAAMADSLNIPGKKIDYKRALEMTCLAHDLGHPPFGHDGQKLLNKYFKKKGLEEGFDDNAQTLETIQKHKLEFTDYELASLIKYPKKLYPYQQKKYLRFLNIAIDEDLVYYDGAINFTKKRSRTFACDIMDKVDEIAYICSDNSDFYLLRYGDEKYLLNELNSGDYQDQDILEFFLLAIDAIKKDNKVLIKGAFNKLKFMMCDNYYVDDDLQLRSKREELVLLKDRLYQFELKYYIHSDKTNAAREVYLGILTQYIDWVFEGNYPSRTYKKLIKNAKTEEIRLRMIRDMIAETTDLYILKWFKEK